MTVSPLNSMTQIPIGIITTVEFHSLSMISNSDQSDFIDLNDWITYCMYFHLITIFLIKFKSYIIFFIMKKPEDKQNKSIDNSKKTPPKETQKANKSSPK